MVHASKANQHLIDWLVQKMKWYVIDLMSEISNAIAYNEENWVEINDETPIAEVMLLLGHGSPVVRLLAKQRSKNRSVYDTALIPDLCVLLHDAIFENEDEDKPNFDMDKGAICMAIQILEETGNDSLASQWRQWGHQDFYDLFV